MKFELKDSECSNMVQDMMDVLAVPKQQYSENFFHPYLDYQTDWKPRYNTDINYANLFVKMCTMHSFLNDKLKDEVLLKSL